MTGEDTKHIKREEAIRRLIEDMRRRLVLLDRVIGVPLREDAWGSVLRSLCAMTLSLDGINVALVDEREVDYPDPSLFD